jgi:predicted deacylase
VRVGQEALGAASDGAASDGASTDGAVLGAERLGEVVAAGELQATTAPPTEAASARASRIRLNMMSGSSVARERQGLHR